MSAFFPLRDLSGRKIPGMPNVVELPHGSHPGNYELGVYKIGEMLIPIDDLHRLPQEEQDHLLRYDHMLLYGYRGREMRLAETETLTVKRVAVGLALLLLAAHPLLYHLA